MRKVVYFDMDGVLVDFYTKAKEITAPSKNKFWKQVSKIGTTFWTSMDEIPGTRDLINFLKKHDFEINILSKLPVTDTANAFIGKSLWLNEHYPNTFTHIILTTGNKRVFAKDGFILIDDKTENVVSWNQKGGCGLLYTDSITLRYWFIDNFSLEVK